MNSVFIPMFLSISGKNLSPGFHPTQPLPGFFFRETPTKAKPRGFPSDPAREDYITARVASFLGIDLTALDPDGIGEEGGMFRLNVFGAALPTLFGVWWDTRRFLYS